MTPVQEWALNIAGLLCFFALPVWLILRLGGWGILISILVNWIFAFQTSIMLPSTPTHDRGFANAIIGALGWLPPLIYGVLVYGIRKLFPRDPKTPTPGTKLPTDPPPPA
jgi:hypothetical protein